MESPAWFRRLAEALVADVRFALRSFRRSPAFSITAVMALGLGIGAATGIFAIANSVLLQPLPYPAPDRVAILWARTPDAARVWLSPPELQDIRERTDAFSAVAGLTDLDLALTGGGSPQQVRAVGASASLFAVLGVRPILGRAFEPSDDVPNAAPVVILSDALWRGRFGGRHDILGATVTLDGRSYTVVGVVPPEFTIPPPSSVFPAAVDVWLPLEPHLSSRGRDVRFLHVLGRLATDRTLADAQGQLDAMAAALIRSYPEYRSGDWRFEPVELQKDVVRHVRPAIVVLIGIVGVVLFIACGNVAGLLLSRAPVRAREISVRAALGANRWRLVRQLLTEGLLLASAGGAAGLALASAVPLVARVPPLSSIPRFENVAIDSTVMVFAFALALLTAALFTLAPLMFLTSDRTTQLSLRGTGRGATRARGGRIFVTAQIALTFAVLAVAVLLAQTFGSLVSTDPGFATSQLLTFRVTALPKHEEPQSVVQLFDRMLDRVRALPGVAGAAGVTQLPLSGASLGSTFLITREGASREDADLRGVTPDYFLTMGIAVREGRTLTSSDRHDSPAVAVVDEQFATRAWPGESAIGKRIRWFRQPDRDIEVVGVVASVRHRGLDAEARPTVYRPHAQYTRRSMFIVVRTPGGAAGAASALTAAIHEVDSDQPVAEMASMQALAVRSLAQPGLGAGLGVLFGSVAMALTTIGIYGLFAYAVSERRREIGVRLALGAQPSDIVAMVLREGARVGGIGLLVGVPATLAALALTRRFLVSVAAVDILAFAGPVVTIALAVAVACWIPARRASRVSPAEPLRAE